MNRLEARISFVFLLCLLPYIGKIDVAAQSVAETLSTARAADGQFISWKEHLIDDSVIGQLPLSGSDGLEIRDLDGDGHEDIVSVHESDTVYNGKPIGHIRIAWGSADPHSWKLSTLASGPEAAAAEDVAIDDVNGDGFPDVLVACELAHLIYFQNPGGPDSKTKAWPRAIPKITTERGSYIRVFLADLNGDRKPEAIAANKGEQSPDPGTEQMNNISIYLIPDDPLAGNLWREQVLGKVRIPINCEPVDLDSDGDLDVVGGSRGERRIIWFENKGDFVFAEHPIQPNPPVASSMRFTGFNMDFADLDGDDRIDIVSTMWPGAVVLLEQPADKRHPWQMTQIGTIDPDHLCSVRLADIDGDKDLDMLVGGYSRGPRDRDGESVTRKDPVGRIAWFQNPGAGADSTWERHDISRRKRGMYDKWLFRDLDHDGDLDALGTRGNSAPYDGVIWLEHQRSQEPRRAFIQAREKDSQQMSLP